MKIKKLIKINNLKKKIELLKKNNKKIVLCHGVFDLTHVGHHRYFKAAKSYGDYLVVSLTVDKFVSKGYDRPFFNQFYRAESLSSLDFVDFIIFSHEASAVSVINQLKPDYYAKGKEYQNEENDISKKIILEKKAVKKNNGKTVFIDEQVFSSSKILNNSDLIFNKEQKKFLSELKKKYTYIDVLNYLKSLENTKTLIIGEIIIDKYIYVEALGKSGKEPYLAFNEISQETYLGGAAAIARQTYQFANNVRLISMVGEKKEFLNFLNTELGNKIKKSLILKNSSPTIIKKRFIDNISGHKIFGTYIFNDSPLIKSQEIKLKKLINSFSKNNYLIIISDYGHGFISSEAAKKLSKLKNFISLNAQINAANVGYHTLRKYLRADTMIINKQELRHEMRNKESNIIELAKLFIKNMRINNLIITMGSEGAILISKNNEQIYCPAFVNTAIDKVGAGDTMLSLLSLCLKNKVPKDLSLFLGSIIGAMSVRIMANKKSIMREDLLKKIEYMFK